MRDGPGRRTIKAAMRFIYWIEIYGRRLWWRLTGRGPRFHLLGECNGCGQCCERPSITLGAVVFHIPQLRAAFLWWQATVNGFHYDGLDIDTQTIHFRCSHYDPETKLCDSYRSRPGICRDYPRMVLDAAVPRLFDDCSYHLVHVRADAIREAIDRNTDDPDLRRKLRAALATEQEPDNSTSS